MKKMAKFERYGQEWADELKNLSKDTIIAMYRETAHELMVCQEVLKALTGERSAEDEIRKEH